MPDINMPKLSDTMEEGTIVEWKKKSGDQVKTGEVLAEVESDKATFDLEAEADGVLQILVEQGVPAKIGAPIAKIGEAGEAAPAKQPAQQKAAAEPKGKEPEAPAPKAQPVPAPGARVGSERGRVRRGRDDEVDVLCQVVGDAVEPVDPHRAHGAGGRLGLAVHEVVDDEGPVR